MKKDILTREEIIHLAKLANLKLTDEEIAKYQKQLTETLAYVENLKELKTEGVDPTNQSTSLVNIGFTDGEADMRVLSSDDALKNAQKKQDHYFEVNRILEQTEL